MSFTTGQRVKWKDRIGLVKEDYTFLASPLRVFPLDSTFYEEWPREECEALPPEARFIVLPESVSNHCCFSYSVLDTQGGDVCRYTTICECFEESDALLVAAALNAMKGTLT